MFMLRKIVNYFKSRQFYIWLLIFSFFTAAMSPNAGSWYGSISIYILYYLIYIYNKRSLQYLVWFVVISLSLYYPISTSYGSLNSGIIAAFLETNLEESFSFLKEIKFSKVFMPTLFILSAIILIRMEKYNVFNKATRKLNILLCVTFVISIIWRPTEQYLKEYDGIEDRPWTLSNSAVSLVSFYADIYNSINGYFSEKNELENASKIIPPWEIESVFPKYKNYVLIIGESARRDYLSTYGFRLSTSPFLDRANGYINAGYIAAAPATYHSLLNTLYFKSDKFKKIDYSYNIITLAKAAGIKTVWLSNQGSMGKYDTIASRLGASSDVHFFTKKGAYNTAKSDDNSICV